MRKEERILNALSDVKEEYIEAVEWEEKPKRWVKWIGLAASVVILLLLGVDWVKGPNGEDLQVITAAFDLGTMGSGQVSEEELDTGNQWNETMEIDTLPVYKNLAYNSPAGEPVYLSREQLLEMAEDVAEKLGTKVTVWEYGCVIEKTEKKDVDVYQITATTDLGEIEVSGNGEIYITFTEGVNLSEGYQISDDLSIEEANKTIEYLMNKFSEVINIENLKADAMARYDLLGNRYMIYRAVGNASGKDGILEYYFNKVSFYGDEERGLTALRYGDIRVAAELLGDYPIVTSKEAKECLKEGYYIANFDISEVKNGIISDDNIKSVELVYMTGSVCQYYQPYYCFFVELEEEDWGYGKFYVPALEAKYLADFEELYPFGN